MASRVPVRWFWRDMRLVFVLLVWAAFGTGLFAYFDGSINLTINLRPPAPAQAVSDDALYTGSIVVVPTRGDRCWQMMLDNRTGRMWESGYMDCDTVVEALTDSNRTGASAVRLNAIGSAFRGQ
jgi:hypothetical protein